MEAGPQVRLRQAVLVAGELEPVEGKLREALGLGEPFRDPGVGAFGLVNGVFALGDCFLEVVSPVQEGTAAGRYLERQGDGGYMAIFDLEDLEGARERAREMGIRTVWEIDLPDISTTHLHPADIGGAIVSVDRSRPYGSWRWGGPDWTERIGEGAPGRLAGITVAVPDPAAVAGRWARVLGPPAPGDAEGRATPEGDERRVASEGGEQRLALDDGEVRFVAPAEGGGEGLVEIAVELPPEQRDAREAVEVGGVRLRLGDLA